MIRVDLDSSYEPGGSKYPIFKVMDFETRNLKHLVLGPSAQGFSFEACQTFQSEPFYN